MNRRNLLLFALTSLCGCASGVWNLPSYDDLPPEKSGVVMASVGGQWIGNARFGVGFRPVATPDTVGSLVFLRQGFSRTPVDIEADGVYATVATRRLPPGQYEIYGAGVTLNLGGQAYFWYGDKRPFSFRFEIVPGKVTYLGEFLGFSARGTNSPGGEQVSAFYTVRDRLSRDLDLLRKRGIDYPPESVIRAVMTKSQSENSVFRRMDDTP